MGMLRHISIGLQSRSNCTSELISGIMKPQQNIVLPSRCRTDAGNIGARKHPRALVNLLRRFTMDTLSSNTPKNNPSFVYPPVNGIAKIVTRRGEVILVSECDADYVSQVAWYCNVYGYAVHELKLHDGVNKTTGRKNKKTIYMHRVIMEMMLLRPLEQGELVDHIDGDALNNCRCNLRIATRLQNRLNSKKRTDVTSSKYKGVEWYKSIGRWIARITVNKKQLSLGTFSNEEDAASAYNEAAIRYFGEYACLNDVPVKNPNITQRSFEW